MPRCLLVSKLKKMNVLWLFLISITTCVKCGRIAYNKEYSNQEHDAGNSESHKYIDNSQNSDVNTNTERTQDPSKKEMDRRLETATISKNLGIWYNVMSGTIQLLNTFNSSIIESERGSGTKKDFQTFIDDEEWYKETMEASGNRSSTGASGNHDSSGSGSGSGSGESLEGNDEIFIEPADSISDDDSSDSGDKFYIDSEDIIFIDDVNWHWKLTATPLTTPESDIISDDDNHSGSGSGGDPYYKEYEEIFIDDKDWSLELVNTYFVIEESEAFSDNVSGSDSGSGSGSGSGYRYYSKAKETVIDSEILINNHNGSGSGSLSTDKEVHSQQ